MFDIHRLSVYILLYNKLVTLYVWHTQAVSVIVCLTYTGCQWHCMFDIHGLSVYILLYDNVLQQITKYLSKTFTLPAGVVIFHLTSPGLFVDDFLLAWQIQVLALAWKKLPCSPWKITFGLLIFCIFCLQLFRDHSQVVAVSICYLLTWKIVSDFADSWSIDLQYFQV